MMKFSQPVLETQHFLLREFSLEDRAQLVACHADPEFRRFHTGTALEPGHADVIAAVFLSWQNDQPRQNFQFSIAPLDKPDSYCGNIGVRARGHPPGQAEIGLELLPLFWGRGAGTQLMQAFLPWATRTLGIRRFVADSAAGNVAAARIAARAGLRMSRQGDTLLWSSP